MGSDLGIRAVVLAGGRGTRLAPYTIAFPKPLVPLGDLPIIEIVLRQLAWYGITEVVISVGHLASLIEAYFATRPIAGVEISYLRESDPLGTAGALSLLGKSDDDLLVINGDLVTTLEFTKILEFHKQRNSDLTIGVHTKDVQVDLGVLEIGEGDIVTGYLEKPVTQYQCSMGVYIYSPLALSFLKKGERLDFPELVLKMIQAGKKVTAFRSQCYWLDIGRHEDYQRASEEFQEMRSLLLRDELAN